MLGVVIGRFQVESLHPGHRYLITEALRAHAQVIVFVGCAPIQGTRHAPLDYFTRERMLRAAYPDVKVLPLYDMLSDADWSRQVDDAIQNVAPQVQGARLYGGRDSFQAHYHGRHQVVVVDSGVAYESGSEQRANIAKVERGSGDFRAGIIYSTQHQRPYVKACVDVACIRGGEVLLGRKAIESKWRLPGGMVDPGETLEEAASRELREETGLTAQLDQLNYLGSAVVGDWRFKHVPEIRLTTALFMTPHTWGPAQAGSDLVECKWFALQDAERHVTRGHRQLITKVQEAVS